MTKEEIQYEKMTKTPIKKLVLMLGIPTMISMLITSLYNIADTFFVSQLGKSASGAVGVVFSLMAIFQAVGFTLGMGGGSLISNRLGNKDDETAQKIGANVFYIGLGLAILIMISGLIFINPLMNVLGSTETVLPYAKSYARYILYGAPVMICSFILNNILRAEGKASFSMIGLVSGGILNIILDPLFIHVFKMGITGAAIATLISQSISFFILLFMFLSRKTIITLSIRNMCFRISLLIEILLIGLPSLFRQGFASFASILLNNQAGLLGGDDALSAMTIVSKIFMVIFSISLGIGQGYQPVVGYNYANKNYQRVKEAMTFTFFVSLVTLFGISLFFFVFSKPVMNAFINDEDVVAIGIRGLKYQCISMPFLSVNVIVNMTYQSIRKKGKALFTSILRQGIFFIPLILILPIFLKIEGVLLAQPLADILTFLVSIIFFWIIIKKLNKLIKNQALA